MLGCRFTEISVITTILCRQKTSHLIHDFIGYLLSFFLFRKWAARLDQKGLTDFDRDRSPLEPPEIITEFFSAILYHRQDWCIAFQSYQHDALMPLNQLAAAGSGSFGRNDEKTTFFECQDSLPQGMEVGCPPLNRNRSPGLEEEAEKWIVKGFFFDQSCDWARIKISCPDRRIEKINVIAGHDHRTGFGNSLQLLPVDFTQAEQQKTNDPMHEKIAHYRLNLRRSGLFALDKSWP